MMKNVVKQVIKRGFAWTGYELSRERVFQNQAVRQLWYRLYQRVQNIGMQLEAEYAPRDWSNDELIKIGHLFSGDIVNISGWRDQDRSKKRLRYADYFPNKRSYTITNYPGERGLDDDPATNSIPLDLEQKLPGDFESRWDVVFCHTTLEHVFDIQSAVATLAELTRDICIVVVPFIQNEHCDDGSYGDYWRFTPTSLDRMFALHGLATVYVSANDQPYYPIYIFYVGSRHPERWQGKLPTSNILNTKVGANYYAW
jgi:hypothetical protein